MLDVGVVDAGVEVGVAGDAHEHAAAHRVPHKCEMAEGLEQLFHRHHLDLFAVADAVEAVGGGVEVHDADHAAALPLEVVDHVVLAVFKLHHGVLGVQHHHGQQRQHVREEVVLALLALARGEFGRL